jgi:transposase
LGAGSAERVPARLAQLVLPPALAETLAPLRRVLETLNEEIHDLDAGCETTAAGDAVVQRLQSVPGVGPIVALTFRAYVDDLSRFTDASQVSAAMGLVPREDSSAERRHRGHITTGGPTEVRSLLVQAAWSCWRTKRSGTLHAWVERVAARRGRRIAVVALARRLSRILYAIWRDQSRFDAKILAAA